MFPFTRATHFGVTLKLQPQPVVETLKPFSGVLVFNSLPEFLALRYFLGRPLLSGKQKGWSLFFFFLFFFFFFFSD